MFDCEACEFRCKVDGLDADNLEAWRLYGRMTMHRWVWDLDCGPWWVARVWGEVDEDAMDDLMQRVSVIYDTLHPPKAKPNGA